MIEENDSCSATGTSVLELEDWGDVDLDKSRRLLLDEQAEPVAAVAPDRRSDGSAPQQVSVAFHPIADLFPLLEGAAFAALAADIGANGLRVPITMLDDCILDGRNRYRACVKVGIIPRFEKYDGKDPLEFVVSVNMHRRHLTESQRAMVAATLATMPHGGDRRSGQAAMLPLVSQSDAAKMFGVSTRSIRSARMVREHGGPELVRRVEQGKISVSRAAKVAVPQIDPVSTATNSDENAQCEDLGSCGSSTPEFTPRRIDAAVWSRQQADALRAAGQAGVGLSIDWQGAALEVEAAGQRLIDDLATGIAKILNCLIKLDLATPDHGRQGAWYELANHARREVRLLLESAPSLIPLVPDLIQKKMQDAPEVAQTGLAARKRRAFNFDRLSLEANHVIGSWFPDGPPATRQPHSLDSGGSRAYRIDAAAQAVGLRAFKNPKRRYTLGYRIVDRTSGAVVAGERYELTMEQVLTFCSERSQKMKNSYASVISNLRP